MASKARAVLRHYTVPTYTLEIDRANTIKEMENIARFEKFIKKAHQRPNPDWRLG